MVLTTQRFAAFTPADTTEYYTAEHRPKYISPLTSENKYAVFHLRSPIESEQIYHQGFALYENPPSNGHDTRPAHTAFYVEDIGIIPADRLQVLRA